MRATGDEDERESSDEAQSEGGEEAPLLMAPDGSSEGGAFDGGEVVITLIGLANSGRSSLANALSCSRVAEP